MSLVDSRCRGAIGQKIRGRIEQKIRGLIERGKILIVSIILH